MILIAHKGNINGINAERENSPEYIKEALAQGYDVEIDVWYTKNGFMLGHDAPQYYTTEPFLENEKLWCHAKNISALEQMLGNKKIHCFWHQEDDVTLTSRGVIWTYPGKKVTTKSICVMPELHAIINKEDLPKCFGVCSDFIANFTK